MNHARCQRCSATSPACDNLPAVVEHGWVIRVVAFGRSVLSFYLCAVCK